MTQNLFGETWPEKHKRRRPILHQYPKEKDVRTEHIQDGSLEEPRALWNPRVVSLARDLALKSTLLVFPPG